MSSYINIINNWPIFSCNGLAIINTKNVEIGSAKLDCMDSHRSHPHVAWIFHILRTFWKLCSFASFLQVKSRNCQSLNINGHNQMGEGSLSPFSGQGQYSLGGGGMVRGHTFLQPGSLEIFSRTTGSHSQSRRLAGERGAPQPTNFRLNMIWHPHWTWLFSFKKYSNHNDHNQTKSNIDLWFLLENGRPAHPLATRDSYIQVLPKVLTGGALALWRNNTLTFWQSNQ